MLDFKDPIVERKLTFSIAQKGCALHFDRYLCLIEIDESVSKEFEDMIVDMSKTHYEADFIVGTKKDTNNFINEHLNDNIYLLEKLTNDELEFLVYKSQVFISKDELNKDVEIIKNEIIEGLKREKFKRDETTKVYRFVINHSQKNT